MWRSLLLRASFILLTAFSAFLIFPQTGEAKNNGGDPPPCDDDCPSCVVCPQIQVSYSWVSLTEGNLSEDYKVARVMSAFGSVMDFKLIYNSYNSDNSRASIDSMVGVGWTHTYNDFLFAQGSDMFRMRGDGRIVRYALRSGGTYQTSPGYFERLFKNPDGSFDVTTKHQTRFHYQTVPNTPFLVRGPVLRLTSITDRNNNLITLTYSGGNLITVTDTYGRSFHLKYNASHHLAVITDPAGRTTTITYNSSGCLITAITDPSLHSRTYAYNALFQLTTMVDRDDRRFDFQYRNNLPYAELDANGGRVYALSNTSNWATDPTQLALSYLRVYTPSTTSKSDGRGNVWQYTYDSNAHPVTVVAPDGATTTYSYDPATLKVSSVTDSNLHTTNLQYDSEGNLTQLTDALGHITTYTYEPVFNQMTSLTDPNGHTTTYTYDGRGNRLSETDPLGGTRSWAYDPHGNVLTATDKDGNTTGFVYDSFGNLQQSNDARSDVTIYTYDVMGNRTSMTDANSHSTSYQYDSLYRLTKQTDALGGTRRYTYDGESNRLKVVDEDSHATTYAYDLRRRMIKTTDALGRSTSYTYDANNNQLSVTDRNGHSTIYAYDVQNRLIRTTDALGHVSTSTYDGAGNRQSATDADGHTTTYLYDSLDRRTQAKDALSEVTRWGYDLTGLPGHSECTGPSLGSKYVTAYIDANGKATYYCYDGLDRLIIEIHKQGSTAYTITANDAVTYFTYDANSNRLTLTEPDGNVTTYAYDALNRETRSVNAAGDTTVTTYDPVGNIHTLSTPNSNVTTNSYNALNRLVQQVDSQAIVQTTAYDPAGNVLSRFDGNGNGLSYAYDSDNRAINMTDSLGKSTVFAYDPVGNLRSKTDRVGNVTTYRYDAIDRRVAVTDAQPATTRYQYDNVGNLTTLTDAKGHATTFTYDAVNRRIAERYADLSHNTVTYTYDAVGHRSSRTDQKGQTTAYTYSDLYFLLQRNYPVSPADVFTYDLSGRLLSGVRGTWIDTYTYDGGNRVIQSVQNGRTIRYTYNVPGRVRVIGYPGGRSITEQRDFRDSLSTVNDGGPTSIVRYTYDAAERVRSRLYRNGTVASYNYNANNWDTSLTHTMGANLIVGFTYAYDNEGNKAYEQKIHDSAHSEGYAYDPVYRLIDYKVGTVVGSTITMVTTQTTYSLDPLGNWNSKVTDTVTQTRTHSPSNEILSINTTPVVSDFNGNTSDDGTNLYSYDEENRLVQVSAKSTHAVLGQYQYDAFGRRVAETDNFGVKTLFYYDGWRTVEEQSSTGVTQATYVFGNYLDETLTMDRSGQAFYYHQNSLFSPYALSDSAGNGVEGYSYEVYGYQTLHLPGPDGKLWTADDVVLPGAKSSHGNPFLLTGQRYDPETGLLYYRARNYDPLKGRFLQRDPLESLIRPNLYEYVLDRPTRYTDPDGLDVTEQPDPNYFYDDELYKVGSLLYKKLAEFKDPDDKAKETLKRGGVFNSVVDDLKGLKDKPCPTIKVFYVTGPDKVAQFAENAAKDNKDCTVSLYFGHGEGDPKDTSKASPRSVKAVKDALGGKNVPQGDNGSCRAPKYGTYSCYGGTYNSEISKDNQAAAPVDTTTEAQTGDLAKHFADNFEKTKAQLDDMCKCCDNKVTLRLYFGAHSKLDEPEATKDNTFDKW
jgi:RHS repeat-associated protein